MQSELVPQWTDKTKDSLTTWRQMSVAGLEAMGKMSAQVFNLQNYALIGRTAMEASAELRRTEESMLNQFLQTQIAMFPLGASADIIENFSAVYTDAVTRLTKQQMDLLHIYVDGLSNCFETLKKSRSAIDVMAAQMSFFTEVQQKTKDNVVDTMMIFEGIKTAVNAVVESAFDKSQVGDVAGKSG